MKNYTFIIKRTGKKYYQSYKVVETSRTFDISLISRSYVFFKYVYGLNLLRTRCRILTLFFFFKLASQENNRSGMHLQMLGATL